jgi:hypothetical protein
MDTDTTLKHAYAHSFEDGIFEIGFGILLAGVGALRAIIHFASGNPAAYFWLSAGLLLFMIGFAWGSTRIGQALKARITYPRTGFMAFKPRTYNYKIILSWLVALIMAGILGAMVGVLAVQADQTQAGAIVSITMGFVGALAFCIAAQRLGVKRFYYLAAISLGVGLLISALGVGVVLGLSFFYLSIGMAMIVTGGLALVLFLRSHEPVDLDGMSQ